MNLQSPFELINKPRDIIYVDEWKPRKEDKIVTSTNGFIEMPLSNIIGVNTNNPLYKTYNNFNMIKKRCYNSDKMRPHTSLYLNYFFKFYDKDKELLSIYAKIKYMIDYEQLYGIDAFKFDIQNYILGPNLKVKLIMMNDDNYTINLTYNRGDESLKYDNEHGKILMLISLYMNILIPLITHFIYIKQIIDVDGFIASIYDIVINTFSSVHIINKLYETVSTRTNKSERDNKPIWVKQDIRGIDTLIESLNITQNIIINIIPKYIYSQNMISYNFSTIRYGLNYKVLNNEYQYNLISLSNSSRDENDNSEFDKFEAYQIKQDESLYMQNVVNSEKTMEIIEAKFGPFNQDEIDFYLDHVNIMNMFQKLLIFNLFYKYFGDPVSIKAINKEDYIKLMIAAKKMLLLQKFRILPYILSSEITKQVNRKKVNKKEKLKLKTSSYYAQIKNKYRDEEIEKQILSMIASILSSKFKIVDYYDKEIDGIELEINKDIMIEELLIYITMI